MMFLAFCFRENLGVNDALMELFILAYACRTSCARRITGKAGQQEQFLKYGVTPVSLVEGRLRTPKMLKVQLNL